MAIQSNLESTALDEPSDALQNASFYYIKMQNVELVNLKCVTCAQFSNIPFLWP